MSRDRDQDEVVQLFWKTMQEAMAVRTRVDRLGQYVGQLRRLSAVDASASQYVKQMGLELDKLDALNKDLLSHLRQRTSASKPASEPAGTAAAAAAKKTILVIDDERSVLSLVDRVLSSKGYQVETACGGLTGIQKVDAQFYQLVVIDLKMPEVAGRDVYEHIEGCNPSQARHVVFFSGDVVSSQTASFLNRTGRPFLVKPFSIKELVEFVEDALVAIKSSSEPAVQ